MKSCYDEAIETVERKRRRWVNPIYDDDGSCTKTEILESDTILYEWKVNREQWQTATKPIKNIYVKAYIEYFIFIIFCCYGIPIIMDIILNYFSGFLNYILLKRFQDKFFGILSLSTNVLLITLTLHGYNRVFKSDKYSFFMTNWGIFNGRVYSTKIESYRIYKNENRVSIFLTQCNMGNLRRGNATMGAWISKMQEDYLGTDEETQQSPCSFWNDFIYNDEDKIHIFSILDLWEEHKVINADNYTHYSLLKEYLKNQPKDQVEKIKEDYKKHLYYKR